MANFDFPGLPIFATTHWSVVVSAADAALPEASQALGELCMSYWDPLYAYARRLGHDVHTAEDLTQEFFRRLIEKHYLGIADRRRGKFRWFLLAAFKAFLANEWDRVRAQKRGGGRQPLSLDALSAEDRCSVEPADPLTAQRIYDRRWALTLLDRARERLRVEYATAGKQHRFETLEQHLAGDGPSRTHAETGKELGMSEGAVKIEVHRLKKRYAEVLRTEVARTVGSPDDVEAEVHYLADALSAA